MTPDIFIQEKGKYEKPPERTADISQ